MRDYSKVSPKFWIGKTGKAMRGNVEAQVVALYLMTCPTSEMTGVFHCPLMYIAHETGLGLEGASKGLRSLIEMDFCTFDEGSDWIFVHEMAKWQIGEELKVTDNQVKSVKKAYLTMKDEFKAAFFERYHIAFHLPESSPLQAPSKPRTGTRTETRAVTGTGSAPSGAGGEPPGGQDNKSQEQKTKDELWAAGKSLLLQSGMPEKQCGPFVGKLVKDYGPEIVIDAVRSAVVERPADPASFLKAACMARKKEGGKTLIPWHATDAGVIAKGLEMDPPMEPHRGETMPQFKARLVSAIDNGGKPPDQKPRPVIVIEEKEPKNYKPEGIPPLRLFQKPREQA